VIKDHPWGPQAELGTGLVLDGTWTLGSTATPEEVATVRKIVRTWKPAHMVCEYIVIVFDETEWDSDPPSGDWHIPGNRSEAAAYWAG
jgi:hypothetical protein